MKIFSGRESRYFAEDVCKCLEVELGNSERVDFSDGEFTTYYHETVRGENVYIIQSTFQPSDNFMELLMMVDAAKRSGAANIIAVVPYMGYSRQDKKDAPRVPITSAVCAKMLESAGVNQVITMDLHAPQIEAYYNIPVSHIYSSTSLVPYLKNILNIENLMVCSPDLGASKRGKAFAGYFGTDLAICYKQRTEANKIKEMMVIGDVVGKDILIVDDMSDTSGTLCKCADMLMEKGAKSVSAAITHPVLSGNAYKNLGESKIERLIVTNSIPLKSREIFEYNQSVNELCGYNKIKVVNVAPLFADVIKNIENRESISSNFLVK